MGLLNMVELAIEYFSIVWSLIKWMALFGVFLLIAGLLGAFVGLLQDGN